MYYNTTHMSHSCKKNYTSGLFAALLTLFVATGSFNDLQAQCAVPPAAGACSGGNGAATNGVNINTGQTFWYAATGTFPSGVNLNAGGTLRVCGNLTLSTITFNGGNIIIEAGGTLTINGGGSLGMNGNSIISNRGTLNLNLGIVMQNLNNTIFNATPTAIINMIGGANSLSINSTTSNFINNGTANIPTLVTQGSASAGDVCLGPASCMNLTNLTNNVTNTFIAPAGFGVVRYTGNALLNNNLTNTATVVVCKATGATKSGSATFGSATVVENCASCAAILILPIELLFFNGKQEKETIELSWATATELNNDYFGIEKSIDGIQWNMLGNIPGAGSSTQILRYTFKDNMPDEGVQYYRLKQTDFDGTFTYSTAIAINFEGPANGNSIAVYPNPNSSNQLNFRGIGHDIPYTLELKKVTGELLYHQTLNTHSIALPAIEKGVYLITLQSEGNFELKTFKYIVI